MENLLLQTGQIQSVKIEDIKVETVQNYPLSARQRHQRYESDALPESGRKQYETKG